MPTSIFLPVKIFKQLAFQPANVELLAARDLHVLKHYWNFIGGTLPSIGENHEKT